MGNLFKTCTKVTKDDPKNINKGPVKQREAAVNRVNQEEMQIAELKSRANKIKDYRKKMER